MDVLDRSSPWGPPSTVQFSRSNIMRRSVIGGFGIQAEMIEITRRVPFEFGVVSPSHLLTLVERGSRYDGETLIEDMAKSTIRDFGQRLILVPAGHRLHGWHKLHILVRVTHFHIDPAGPLLDPAVRFSAIEFKPRLYFQDRDLLESALKLKRQFEQPGSRAYAEALGIVLVHELIQANGAAVAQRAAHGGLAAWQQRRLTEYIAEHLADEISLIDLADIAQLSPFHFVRTFKQTFGDPPHRYLMHQRIEHAKRLLENPARSVNEIAQAVGFADPASFTAAFRRSVGTTPTGYRHAIA